MRKQLKALGVMLIMALTFSGVALVATPSPAAASTATFVDGIKYAGGPGHETTVYAGIWVLDGKRGPCIDFGLITPDSTAGTKVITKVPGMTAEQSQRAFTLVEKYRGTRSDTTAAALSLAVWQLKGDADFRKWYRWAKKNGTVPAAMVKRVDAMLRESKSHGPYKVSVKLSPVLKGQKGSGSASVVDSRGKPAKGLVVKVGRTTAGAKILGSSSVRTNKNGVAKFRFQRLNEKRVGFKATVTVPSVKKALLSRPSAGRQRLLVGGFRDSFSGSAQYDSSAGKPTISTVCDTDCDGEATLTVSYKNPKNNTPVRWMIKNGKKTVLTLDVKPGAKGSESVRVMDGQVLKVATCTLKKGKCLGKAIVLKKKYEVVCPAWPEAEIVIPCSCDPRVQGTVNFTAPAGSPRFYRGFVTIGDGTVVHEVDLVNGVTKVVNYGRVSAGTTVTVSFVAYRDAARTDVLVDQVLRKVVIY